jgi:hypothetical protein
MVLSTKIKIGAHMKNILHVAIITFAIFGSNYVSAKDSAKEILADIKVETKKCAVKLVSGNTEGKTVVGFKSICKSLKILSSSEAQILIDGAWLTAIICESSQSDGGDLDDLTIQSSTGKVLATKKNIPAYDSVIVAMAGDSNIREK